MRISDWSSDVCSSDLPLRPQYNTGDTFVLVGDQVQRVPTTASPITNEAFIAKLDELAQTVSVDAPWAAPNAAKWDAMTYADYLDTSELSPEDRGALNVLTLLTYRSEEHTSELQSLMRISYAVFCLKNKKK